MKNVVMKFGGTSVADADAIRRLITIVSDRRRDDPRAPCRRTAAPRRALDGRRPALSAPEHRPSREGHAPRPVHHGPAGPERLLEREEDLALAYADVVREEMRPLRRRRRRRPARRAVGEGARPQARPYALQMLERALDGGGARPRCTSASALRPSCRHHPPACLVPLGAGRQPGRADPIETAQSNLELGVLETLAGKTVILGVIALDTAAVETPRRWPSASVARCPTRRPANSTAAAPDCGMKYLPRDAAFAKLEALVAGARLVHGSSPPRPEQPRAPRRRRLCPRVSAGAEGRMLRNSAGRGSSGSSGFGRDSVCVPVARVAPRPGPVSLATVHSPEGASRTSQCSSADASALSAAARALASSRVMATAYGSRSPAVLASSRGC